jgi:hypothetical protein
MRDEKQETRDEKRETRNEKPETRERENKSAGGNISKPPGQNEKSANFTGKSGIVCI